MAGTTIPNVPPQFFTNAGAVASGYQLFTYTAGTSTKLATYSDEDLSTPNANPIVLDSAGRATIFLSSASYKFVLATDTDTDPPTSPIWTRDNIKAGASFDVGLDVTGTAGTNIAANDVVYLSDGTGSLTAGRWYKADADETYSSNLAPDIGIAPSAISSGSSGSIRMGGRITGLSGLTIGSVYYVSATAGELTITAPTNERAVGVADTATSLVMALVEGGNEATFPETLPAVSGTNLTAVSLYEAHTVTTVGNVGAGEDTLWSHTMSAGELATDGDAIKFVIFGATANNANTKDLQVRVDDTATDTSILDVSFTVSEIGRWIAGGLLLRVSATTARACGAAQVGPVNSQTTFSGGSINDSFSCVWANAVELRVTGEGTATDDIRIFGGSAVVVKV